LVLLAREKVVEVVEVAVALGEVVVGLEVGVVVEDAAALLRK
jgi:hypothetical protein